MKEGKRRKKHENREKRGRDRIQGEALAERQMRNKTMPAK